jgi:hypothetical protein
MNLFFEFMTYQAMIETYKQEEMTFTVADYAAKKIFGRSFGWKKMAARFGTTGRTAAKKSKYFDEEHYKGTVFSELTELLITLWTNWDNEGYRERMLNNIESQKMRFRIS